MDPEFRTKLKAVQDKLAELRMSGVTDSFELEMYFIDNMPDMCDNYPFLLKKLCREEKQDNSFLYKMIESIEAVKAGKTSMTQVEYKLGEELAEKYLYPVIPKEELYKLNEKDKNT